MAMLATEVSPTDHVAANINCGVPSIITDARWRSLRFQFSSVVRPSKLVALQISFFEIQARFEIRHPIGNFDYS